MPFQQSEMAYPRKNSFVTGVPKTQLAVPRQGQLVYGQGLADGTRVARTSATPLHSCTGHYSAAPPFWGPVAADAFIERGSCCRCCASQAPGEDSPCATAVGSPNYGAREAAARQLSEIRCAPFNYSYLD